MSALKTISPACRLGLAVFMGLAVAAGMLLAAQGPERPSAPMLADVIGRGWLQVRVVLGRISFGGARLANVNNARKGGQLSERLTMGITNGRVAVNYQMSTAQEELLVSVAGGDQLHIRRSPKGKDGPVAVEFRQAGGEPVVLAVGTGNRQRVYRAASLWHLLIIEPQVCREHLLPLVSLLTPHWDLARAARQVEAALLDVAASGQVPDPQQWAALVEELGDDRYWRREAADRQLRALGRVVLPYLRQLDPSQLDAEQDYRIRRIIRSIWRTTQNDSPQEVASWLAGDAAVWLALLGRPERSTRQLAAQRLKSLLGQPIGVDPEADPASQAAQLERLRSRILRE